MASLARRWLGVSTDLVRGGQGVFTRGRRKTDVGEEQLNVNSVLFKYVNENNNGVHGEN